jgi:hypothetical protein
MPGLLEIKYYAMKQMKEGKYQNQKPQIRVNPRDPRQPLRQLTSPTRLALAIRGDLRHPCSIRPDEFYIIENCYFFFPQL